MKEMASRRRTSHHGSNGEDGTGEDALWATNFDDEELRCDSVLRHITVQRG